LWAFCDLGVDYLTLSDWVAGAGGIEPPNGGIKISLIIQRFQGVFGKTVKTRFNNLNRLAAVSKHEDRAP
jgi:hypothetical protein